MNVIKSILTLVLNCVNVRETLKGSVTSQTSSELFGVHVQGQRYFVFFAFAFLICVPIY